MLNCLRAHHKKGKGSFQLCCLRSFFIYVKTPDGVNSFRSAHVNGSIQSRFPQISFLPAATKLWPRLCFYSCLWFCPWGGSLAGRTPCKETPWQGDPSRQGEPPPHPPSRETPLARRPPTRETPWQGGPPGRENPPGKEAPLARRPPRQGEPPLAGRPPSRENPPWQGGPPWQGDPPAYGQWAAGTHPTGMHSCSWYN